MSIVAASVLGYASLGCWIVLFLPQIHTNYKRQSGEGLSVATVLLWMLGDSIGVAGTVLNKLQLTQIILAVFFLLIDGILLGQILYYRRFGAHLETSKPGDLENLDVSPIEVLTVDTKKKGAASRTTSSMEDENSPTTAVVMVAPVLTRNPTGLSTPRQRSGTTVDARTSHFILPPLNPRQTTGATLRTASQMEAGQAPQRSMATLRQMTSLVLAGLTELALESAPIAKGQRVPTNGTRQSGKVVILPKVNTTISSILESGILLQAGQTIYTLNPMADLLGWITYSIYILSRLPQLAKNYQTKSTEGLSRTTYAIRFIAQITYLLSIFLVSMDPAWLRINMPWIVGTSVNFVLDVFVVAQMWYYDRHSPKTGSVVQVPTYRPKESIMDVDIAKSAPYNNV